MREYYRANRERFAEYQCANTDRRNELRRGRYAGDPEFREKHKASVREWQRANPDKRLAQVLRKYGITVDEYRTMLVEQDGGCAICEAPIADGRGTRLHIDHCHESGAARGLLCGSCNLGLGKFRDDPQLLERAALYLRACQRT